MAGSCGEQKPFDFLFSSCDGVNAVKGREVRRPRLDNEPISDSPALVSKGRGSADGATDGNLLFAILKKEKKRKPH